MNQRQKTYDTYDYTTRKLKVIESLYHQRNLYLIKTRKAPKLINSKSTQNTFKKAVDPTNTYFKAQDNQYIAERLAKIQSRPAKPHLNNNFILIEKKKKKHNLKVKKAEKIKIEEENERMFRRMVSMKSFISTKEMDRNYEEEHKKIVKKLRRVVDGKLLLPDITQRSITHSTSITEATLR